MADETKRQVVALFGAGSAASAWMAGAGGLFICHAWGVPLAQLGQMYFFLETEPSPPSVPMPWALAGLFALLPVPVVWLRRWAWLLASALPFALLPWWQLYRLTMAAAPLP